MSDEHDRLLAQGPRVAPEPKMATDDGALVRVAAPAVQAPPSAATTSADNPGRSPRASGSGRSASGIRPTVWRRLIPVLFGLVIAARALGGGGAQAAVFGVLAVVVITLVLVRKARQL